MLHTIQPEQYKDIVLLGGGHAFRPQGLCLMEAVALLAGEPHTDYPQCASRVLGALGRGLNDSLDHEPRQALRRFIPAIIGTVHDGKDPVRSLRAADWLVREWLPRWLESPSCLDSADRLRGLDPVTDPQTLMAATEAVEHIRMVVAPEETTATRVWGRSTGDGYAALSRSVIGGAASATMDSRLGGAVYDTALKATRIGNADWSDIARVQRETATDLFAELVSV
jgi:hypothetical protein